LSISRDNLQRLQRGDFAGVEEDWLRHLETDPSDIPYFVGAARALAGTGEAKRARSLVELLDDELKAKERWHARLDLLRDGGGFLVASERLHPEVVATLKRLYGAKSGFQSLLRGVGLEKGGDPAAKLWEKVDRFEALVSFELGAIVWMQGKGAGRVVDVNVGLEAFKVDFEKQKAMTVGFRAAGKLLRALPEGHLQRRKLEDPESLRGLAPTELLGLVLRSGDAPMTAAEVREAVAGLVSEAQWTSWWTAARRHPQVLPVGSGSRQTYRWAETSADASASAWEAFESADLAGKLDLLRRQTGKERDVTLRDRMVGELVTAAERAYGARPADALKIWSALERAGAAPRGAAWSIEALVERHDPRQLLGELDDRTLRERVYEIARQRRADWSALYLERLNKEEDPRTLNLLYDAAAEVAPAEVGRLLDAWLSQPRKNPAAFTWLAERAAGDEALAGRNPLRLLQQILSALGVDEFAPFRTRLRPLGESGGSLPRLLARLSEDQAAAARESIQRAPGLETYQRTALQNALELRFAALRAPSEQPLYARPASIAARRAELKELLEVEIPANRKAIEEARALGDLRENFEYKSARQRHEYLAARAAALDRDLRRVRPLEPAGAEPVDVRIGTAVRLLSPADAERRLTILGPWESQPEAGVISYESELAKELLGRKIGDVVRFEGADWRIAEISAAE
jgi:transcription elongation GreA/GreB family factor